MGTNNPEVIAWGNDPRKMSEADLLPCPACGGRAGKATKRAAKGLPFVGLWKVSCQRQDCPLAMIYFHPVEWNQLPRIKQSEYEALQAECEKLRGLLAEIGRWCSRRVMPSEQNIASWAEAIDAAIAEGEGAQGGGSNARA